MAAPIHHVRRVLAAAVLAFAGLAAPAQASFLDPESPHSPNADDMTTTYWVMFAVIAIVIVAVHVALFAAVRRFRERREHRPAPLEAGRRVILRVGLGFGALAAAIVVFGIVMTAQTRTVEATGPNGLGASATRVAQVGLRDAPPIGVAPGTTAPTADNPGQPATPGGPLVIKAIGQQWLWRFEYPGNNPQGLPLFSYSELVVPVDTTVILNVTSTDVLHTWWVPSLGGQVQAAPGRVTQTWFKADKEGTYRGQSTTFSGTADPTMRAWVRVVSPEAYQAWVETLQRNLQESQAIVRKQVSAGIGPIAEVSP